MIVLQEIDQSNYKQCAQLKTKASQGHFVAPNWYSLLEANYESNRKPFAISSEGDIIGFIMYSYYQADSSYPVDSWWIERFMIDQAQQGKGYGKEGILAGINWFKQTMDETELRISAEVTNEVAIRLYQKQGFSLTGEEVEGEKVLLLKW